MTNIVLASGSHYRSQLLQKLNINFVTCSPDIDESSFPNESAANLAIRLAIKKVDALSTRFPQHIIIGSDQVAIAAGKQLCKPGNRENAIKQLTEQSGRAVTFHTGLCVLHSAQQQYLTDLDISTVYFKQLTEAQIRHYIELEKPYDCAGSFKSEGLGVALFEKIEGDDPNALIGLPLIKLVNLLNKFNIHVI